MGGARNVLVTGGTGKTGRAVVKGLQRRGLACKVAARTPADGSIRFDWMDESTVGAALSDSNGGRPSGDAQAGGPGRCGGEPA